MTQRLKFLRQLSPGKRRACVAAFIVTVLAVLILVIGQHVTYKTVALHMCEITGTKRVHEVWFGTFGSEEVIVSPLEDWIRSRDPDFKNRWDFVYKYGFQLVGHWCGSGGSPVILMYVPLLGGMMEHMTEEEIASLVETMKLKDSEERQRSALEQASDRYWDRSG